jgi:hypothetical protein
MEWLIVTWSSYHAIIVKVVPHGAQQTHYTPGLLPWSEKKSASGRMDLDNGLKVARACVLRFQQIALCLCFLYTFTS